MQGYIHLVASKNNELDSVVFTAEQFAKDIKETINIIFQKATTEKSSENQITEHVNNFPPIAGKNWIPSSIYTRLPCHFCTDSALSRIWWNCFYLPIKTAGCILKTVL
jgi:hypothetical protein